MKMFIFGFLVMSFFSFLAVGMFDINKPAQNVRYAPKKVWSQYEKISRQEYEYAKNHQEKWESVEH